MHKYDNIFRLIIKKETIVKKIFSILLILTCLVGSAIAQETAQSKPQVVMQTSKGDIVLELYPDKAPLTVQNFMRYVDSGFYNGTIFHRVIHGFMIQGGGFSKEMVKKTTQAPIQNEANNGIGNDRGTIAMARTPNPHSATAQFFINTVDNAFLNFKSQTPSGWGYAVFGKVIEGLDVVDVISKAKTGVQGRMRDVPKSPIEIVAIRKR
jgi:peptidyl-prolyl cis-trans isomerase B (cyclophilin B)